MGRPRSLQSREIPITTHTLDLQQVRECLVEVVPGHGEQPVAVHDNAAPSLHCGRQRMTQAMGARAYLARYDGDVLDETGVGAPDMALSVQGAVALFTIHG